MFGLSLILATAALAAPLKPSVSQTKRWETPSYCAGQDLVIDTHIVVGDYTSAFFKAPKEDTFSSRTKIGPDAFGFALACNEAPLQLEADVFRYAPGPDWKDKAPITKEKCFIRGMPTDPTAPVGFYFGYTPDGSTPNSYVLNGGSGLSMDCTGVVPNQ